MVYFTNRKKFTMKEMEKSFSEYMDSEEAEELFNAFFAAVRKSYAAGYEAASIKTHIENRVINIYDTPQNKEML